MPVRSMRQVAILATILALAIGCSPSQPAASSDPLPSGDASALCPQVHLLGANGQPLNLTGTWFADDYGEYFLTQRASCLHWLGMSPEVADNPDGSGWTNVFVGRIESDFGIHGAWADVPYGNLDGGWPSGSGELSLEVEFFGGDGGDQWPTIHLLSGGERYGGRNWVPTDAIAGRQSYAGTYGFEAGCPWLELTGTRYELVQYQYVLTEQGDMLGEGNEVIARPGDGLVVDAQIWPAAYTSGCLPDAILSWSLEPSP